MKDLEYQKMELTDTEKRHKDIVTRLERKFFEEKIRLQKEANRKISELASKAHKVWGVVVPKNILLKLKLQINIGSCDESQRNNQRRL